MEYSSLQSELVSAIPAIQTPYNVLRDEWDPDPIPNYIVFESLFVPFVEDRINRGDDSNIRKCFEFIETLSEVGDTDTKNLVYIALFEGRDDSFLSRWFTHSGISPRGLFAQSAPKQTTD